MDDEAPMLASAVVIPDLEQDEATPPPQLDGGRDLKRRRPSVDSRPYKRPRPSYGESTDPINYDEPDPNDRPAPRSPRATNGAAAAGGRGARAVRKPLEQADRQRGKRLFGALLGTLSQTKTTPAQRRRAEIDMKQQEKLRSQTGNGEAAQGQNGDPRRREQWRREREERAMRRRHGEMRARAGSLATRARPVLYYKPYELRPEERERVAAQLDEVERVIERELDEFDESWRREQGQWQNGRADGRRAAADRENANEEEVPTKSNGAADPRGAEERGGPPNGQQPHANGAHLHTNGDAHDVDSAPEAAVDKADASHNEKPAAVEEVEAESPEKPPASVEKAAVESPKDPVDDAGEVMEDDEDQVMY